MRPLGALSYESSVFLYSHHQLTALPFLRQVRPQLRLKRRKGDLIGRLDADRGSGEIFRERANRLRDAAIAATLLEPAYYSRIFHRLSLPREEDFAAFDRWRRTRPTLRPLRVLGVDAAWIKDTAEALHWEAHRIDPLGDWAEVIAAGDPEKWKSLSGDVRAALELRVSAELLLLYYDELHRARRAPPLRNHRRGLADSSTTG